MFLNHAPIGAAQLLWEQNPVEARARLDAAAGLSQQTQQELVGLIQTLRPVPLDARPLPEAMRELWQSWEAQTGLTTTCYLPDNLSLPSTIEQALFRVAQEALANIACHSGATAAGLTLEVNDSQIQLIISDNGRGFNAAVSHHGLGLRSMRERVESLGGQWRIESDGHGTRLAAQIPLRSNNSFTQEQTV